MKWSTILSVLYSLATLMTTFIFISYPVDYYYYSQRPIYEIKNFTDYSIVVAEKAENTSCKRYMNYNDAVDRLRFANDINTFYVIFFAMFDYLIMMLCAVGSIAFWFYVLCDPQDKKRLRWHLIIEILELFTLLIISPLSYPSLIDDYKDCLDDNLLMSYGLFMLIQIVFFISVCAGVLLYLAYYHKN